VNAGAQRTPNNPTQRTLTDAAPAISTGVRRALDSGAKIMRRNKNQATSATVQQDDAFAATQHDTTSMTVNTPSVNTPDGSGPKINTAQEHGVMDSNTSFLSDFGARASQASQASQTSRNSHVGTNAAHEFSPIGNQVASPVKNYVASGINLSAPPRQDSSRDNVAVTGMDLLDTPNATASSDSVVGTLIPAPFPRRSTQSPATHQLQQILRNNANEQAFGCDSTSPASSNDSGDAASAFSAFGANNSPTIVETVQEGNSDDGDGWPDGDGLAGNAADDAAQVNLVPRTSEACDACNSGIALGVNTESSHAAANLVIDTEDPGREDFVISVGALGNASGALLDGSQNMSFGEDLASPEERRIVDSATKAAACATYRSTRPGWQKGAYGVKVDDGSESSASFGTPPNFDPSDPEALGDLLSRPPKPINHSPTSTIKFNEQTVVTEHTQSGAASTTVGNLGGTANSRPSSSLPGSAALCQHANAGGGSNGGNSSPNDDPNSNPNSGNSSGNNGSGEQRKHEWWQRSSRFGSGPTRSE